MLALAVPVLRFAFAKWLPEVMGVIVLSAILAHTGWHWMLERGGQLIQYDFALPALNRGFAIVLLDWAILAAIVVVTLLGLRAVFGWLDRRSDALAPSASSGQSPAS